MVVLLVVAVIATVVEVIVGEVLVGACIVVIVLLVVSMGFLVIERVVLVALLTQPVRTRTTSTSI